MFERDPLCVAQERHHHVSLDTPLQLMKQGRIESSLFKARNDASASVNCIYLDHKQFEAELLKDDWAPVPPEVEVKQVAIPQGEETYILCRTSGRKEKEKAIRSRRAQSILAQLEIKVRHSLDPAEAYSMVPGRSPQNG
jgi:hypothetical protein